jgi:hypothetical protein
MITSLSLIRQSVIFNNDLFESGTKYLYFKFVTVNVREKVNDESTFKLDIVSLWKSVIWFFW